MHPPTPADLVTELAAVLRASAAELGASEGEPVVAEWSQVSTSHAGRIHIDGERHALPVAAVGLFQQIRERMTDDTHGAWLSARITLDDEPVFIPNYSKRVYWNSPAMFIAPDEAAPIPTDEEWTAELRRHPRAPDFVPAWVAVRVTDSREFDQLRQALTGAGVPQAAVRLPGESHTTFEGAILVRSLEGLYSVDVFDYGQLHHLGTARQEREAGMIAWNYLTAPMPMPVMLTPGEVEQRAHSALAPYEALRQRIVAAGPGGVVTNLAPGIPYDRWGTIDGLYIYAWATPTQERSLPPTALGEGALRVGLVANRPVPVQAELVPAWFDQPGGGIRFRLQRPVRDYVRAGELSVLAAPARV